MALSADAGKYSRMIPGFNFGSHNVAGCGRTISPFTGSATDCQAACDNNSHCDMWTYVAGTDRPAKPPTPYPWCCQKGCRSNATGLSLCPAPNREVNCTSGVKDSKDYGVSQLPPPCVGDACFQFAFDEASGNASTSFPTLGRFGVRKVEAFLYKRDGKTYAYADIVNYTCGGWTKDPKSCPPGEYFYPDSYSTEVGVFSSPDGLTKWQYHGIVVPRGPAGGWDSGGIASPGAAAAKDGSVIVGYAAENSPSGGRNRGIGIAIASHPLGPFVKQVTAIASPKTICSGTGRCDDVIMQSRPDGVHIYHSVKGSNVAPGDGIRHRMSSDGGKTWGASALVLSTKLQPGHVPAESILGKYFPTLNGGRMVLITDGGKPCVSLISACTLHAYVSKTVGSMTAFIAASGEIGPSMFPGGAPPGPARPGGWANFQVAFFPDADGSVARVGYTLWQNNTVKSRRAPAFGMTMTVFNLINVTAIKVKTDDRSSTVGLAATPPMGFNNCTW